MSLPKRQGRYYKGGLEGREGLLWKDFSNELIKARRAAGNKIGTEIRNKQRAAVRAKLKAAGIDPDKKLNPRQNPEDAEKVLTKSLTQKSW